MRSLKYKITIIGLALFLGIGGVVAEAIAQPKPNVFDGGNRWLITYYNDCDAGHSQWATQGVCYLPYKTCAACGILGSWYSDTYPGWRGRYNQEGDRILMHGNWGNFAGSDSIVIDLFAGTDPRSEGAGQWTEWLNTGATGITIGFGNARLRRVGRCMVPQGVDISSLTEAEIEKLSVDLSSKVKARLRKDGKAAESPTDPEQVPLPEEREYRN